MKTVAVLLAALLALPFQARAPEPQPKLTLLEGFCAALVIGLSIDVVIVIAINCKKSTNAPPWHPGDTNAPPWIVVPPANTNAPPTNGVRSATLQSGDAALWHPCDAGPFTSMFATTLETQAEGEPWHGALKISCWRGDAGQLVLLTDMLDFPLKTNFVVGTVHWLPLPGLMRGDNRQFRLSSTP